MTDAADQAAGRAAGPPIGLVLFAHGARDPRWADTVVTLATRVQALAPDLPVQPAFLEFMAPDLSAAVDALVARGVREIVVAPVFLAAGGHVLRDLPMRLDALAQRHPGLVVRVEPALGSLTDVLDAMARHCLQAVADMSESARHVSVQCTIPVSDPHEKGVDGPRQFR